MDTEKRASNTSLIALAAVIATMVVALSLGVDRNWDLANYHLYNPHAWLTGRYGIDIAPAQLQSWHNPTLDIPLYLLVRVDAHTLLITLWLALPAIVALISGAKLLEGLLGRELRPWEAIACVAMSVSGAALMPTIGSSTNDCFVAAGSLLALSLACSDRAGWGHWLAAGLIAGLTAGLKLTAALYCVSLLAATLASGSPRQLPARVAALGIGGLVGALAGYGLWGFELWVQHGNPFFPYYNHLFHSPDVAPNAWSDLRFRPRTLTDALLAPFRLLIASTSFSELPARDPRLLIGMVCCLAVLAVPHPRSEPATTRCTRMVAVFFLTSLALWTAQYGILRYTAPLEVLSAALFLAVLSRHCGRAYPVIATATIVAIMAFTIHPDWGRRPFSRHFLVADWPELPHGSMLVTATDSPLAFFALGLPRDVPIVAISNNVMHANGCYRLQAMAEDRIRGHAGTLWLLEEDQNRPYIERSHEYAKADYGLAISGDCIAMRSSFGNLRLCPLQRMPAQSRCALKAARQRTR